MRILIQFVCKNTMIIALSRIIEEALVLPVRLAKNRDDVILLHICASNHRIRNSDVLSVMLIVVNLESLVQLFAVRLLISP